MRRRLDIAMSLIGNPPVIFLDEPTTGLDPQARLEVWQAVKELAEQGTTVLLTTQYLDEAEQLADRIAILHEGRIIVNGTLAELKQLLPPAKVEYVEKQPTLEDVFLAIVGDDGGQRRRGGPRTGRTSEEDDDHALLRRHRRPDRDGPCATSRAAWTPSSRPRSCRSPSCCCSSTCSAARSTPGRIRT
jgi:ABC-type multidrug transport system ATPase subunit